MPERAAARELPHAEFLAAWRAGEVQVQIDRAAAASFLSARLMLPFFAIAVIGIGIGLVLWGWIWTGLGVIATGIVAPRLIKRTAQGFVLSQLAHDPDLYSAGVRAGVVRVVPARAESV